MISLEVLGNCLRYVLWCRFVVNQCVNLHIQSCLSVGALKTAGSYLLVLHNLEQFLDADQDIIRLLQKALEAEDMNLCRELVHFLRSIDNSGDALREAMRTLSLDVGGNQAQSGGGSDVD